MALDVALTRVARLAHRTGDRQTGNRHRLASSGLPPIVDTEEPTTSRATNRTDGRARADSNDVRRQPALGRTAHSRRAVETGHRGVSGKRGEVHGSPSPTAVTNLADIPPESHRTDRGGG